MALKKPIKKNIRKAKEKVAPKVEKVFDDLKERYETTIADFEDFSNRTKRKVKKQPYESLAFAGGLGALVGFGLGAAVVNTVYNQKSARIDYRNAFRKSGHDLRDVQSLLEKDIKKKPFQSMGVALGVGVLLGTAMKSMKNYDEK